jgi:hypothetical protein
MTTSTAAVVREKGGWPFHIEDVEIHQGGSQERTPK